MPESRAELLSHYRRMRADLLDAIAGLSEAQLTERSIDGWSVKDHLVHLAAWDELRAQEIRRISAGHGSAWKTNPEREEAYNDLTEELRRDFTLSQARWESDVSHQAVLEAIESATERGLESSHYGEAALRSTHETMHTAWIRRWREGSGS